MLTAEQGSRLNEAYGLLRSGRRAEALALAEEVARQAPKAADAHHLVALCRKEIGDPGAERAFRKALKLSPDHPQIVGNYANWLFAQGRREDALTHYQRAVDLAPDFAQAWLNLGVAALDAGRVGMAERAFGRAVELQPRFSSAWQGLGSARRRRGDLPGAEQALRKAVAAEPRNGPAWVSLGAALRLLGRPKEALGAFEKARAAGFSSGDLADAHAGALIDLGEIDSARTMIEQLIAANPGYVGAYATLAQLLWQYGDPNKPEEDPARMLRDALAEQPGNIGLRFAYARFLLQANLGDEALDFIRPWRRESDNPELACAEANALERLGRSDEAGLLYAEVYKVLGGSDPAFLNAYARHLLKAGKWDVAAARASEAVRTAPNDQEAWAYLSTAWRLLDDPREYWLCDYDRTIALVDVDPPSDFADMSAFLNALKASLDPMHKARREPVNQSLRGGSQTPGRLFGRPDRALEAAHDAFRAAVERRIASLPEDSDHPFFRRKSRSVVIGGAWSVKLWSSGSHVNHIHSEGWMSSAFYVSLPPSVQATAQEERSGWIQFGQPPAELELGLEPRRIIRPEAGKLALFPSYMWHGTVPFEDAAPRMTIAFDMTPAD